MKCLQQVHGRMMMQQNKVIFFAAELTRLFQNVFGNAKFSKVMQKCGDFQLTTLRLVGDNGTTYDAYSFSPGRRFFRDFLGVVRPFADSAMAVLRLRCVRRHA